MILTWRRRKNYENNRKPQKQFTTKFMIFQQAISVFSLLLPIPHDTVVFAIGNNVCSLWLNCCVYSHYFTVHMWSCEWTREKMQSSKYATIGYSEWRAISFSFYFFVIFERCVIMICSGQRNIQEKKKKRAPNHTSTKQNIKMRTKWIQIALSMFTFDWMMISFWFSFFFLLFFFFFFIFVLHVNGLNVCVHVASVDAVTVTSTTFAHFF